MISAIAWVPAGVADPNPKKYEFSAAELELIEMMEQQNIQDAPDTENVKTEKKKKDKTKIENNLPADLRMDEYSSDEDENDDVQGMAIGKLLVEDDDADVLATEENDIDGEEEKGKNQEMGSNDSGDDDDDDLSDVPDTREYTPLDPDAFNAIGLSQVGTNAPSYMDIPDDGEEDDDGSEAEDIRIQADDAIIVVAKTEEDFASLEVHVYEQKTGNLFVHHDIPLPAFPLCLAHGDISPLGTAGNFCAVGTFSPGIEVWNLDVLNALEPTCILGGEDTSIADEIMKHNMMGATKQNKKKFCVPKGPKLRQGSHTDAVMSLSWNQVHRQVIASGSADCTVKLWDITQAGTNECHAGTLRHHKDKVQSVLWHTKEGTLLATGSYDRTVALVDARNSNENTRRVKIPADCEALAWNPFSPECLTAACEDGTIVCWDVRKFSDKTPLWSIVANEYGGVSDLSYNPNVPGMLATCSVDKTVTLWDTYNTSDKTTSALPQACGNKDMGVGKLYTINFYPSAAWLLGCAGGGKELALWDMEREDSVQKRFGERINTVKNDVISGVIDETTKKEDFDAMMTIQFNNETKHVQLKKSNRNKNTTGTSKKKKAHRARR